MSHAKWGFRGMPIAIPGPSRSAFRSETDHDSGMKAITYSDLKPISLGRLSEE
jgi:hypothetical protein